MGKLRYNIIGLQEFSVSFDDFCTTCEYQKKCTFGKKQAFQITLDCKEFSAALDKIKAKKMENLGKKHPNWDWDTREKKAKVSKVQIFSELWKIKIKTQKEKILCMDSRRMDSMLTSQRGEEWWTEFRDVVSEIDKECAKIY